MSTAAETRGKKGWRRKDYEFNMVEPLKKKDCLHGSSIKNLVILHDLTNENWNLKHELHVQYSEHGVSKL